MRNKQTNSEFQHCPSAIIPSELEFVIHSPVFCSKLFHLQFGSELFAVRVGCDNQILIAARANDSDTANIGGDTGLGEIYRM